MAQDFIANKPWFKAAAARAGQRWLFLGPSERSYRFSAPNLGEDGASALLSTKKDGSEYIPQAGRGFQYFAVNGAFQCVSPGRTHTHSRTHTHGRTHTLTASGAPQQRAGSPPAAAITTVRTRPRAAAEPAAEGRPDRR